MHQNAEGAEGSIGLTLDRSARSSLAEQIRSGVAAAIENGVLSPGARLPSWIDLAAQLGVSRGTVRTAYEMLAAAQLVEASRAAGTRVAARSTSVRPVEPIPEPGGFMTLYREMTAGPFAFQMGVPGHDTFPATLFSRIRTHAVRAEAAAPAIYPDPRGEPELRREIAAYLALARGLECAPEQVIVTGGFSAGLGLLLAALGLDGRKAWVEDPGFPFARRGLELARLKLAPVPVDAEGIDVEAGLRLAPDAALAVVTPGQQAPLGATLSLARRLRLLEWATERRAWIVEDDYLGELQLAGRAAPALASLDRTGRVVHLGSFSKTLSPTLRLGFMVAPPRLASRLGEVAACLAPPPGPSLQHAVAAFIRDGHHLRHLRRVKRTYAARRDALLPLLKSHGLDAKTAGLAALTPLPDGVSDQAIAREAMAEGMAPAPLSAWGVSRASARSGLLLGVATAQTRDLAGLCERLAVIARRHM